MEYIEIAEGLSIKVCDICAIAKETDLTCIVYTEVGNFNSTFPYDVLLQLLEKAGDKPEDESQKKQLRILEMMGNYAG